MTSAGIERELGTRIRYREGRDYTAKVQQDLSTVDAPRRHPPARPARPLIRQPSAATFSGSALPSGSRKGRREPAAAVGMDRLYPDVDAQTAEAARRFGLVEEHWDVVGVGAE